MNISREKFGRFDMGGALYIRDLPQLVQANVRYKVGGASGELYYFTASQSSVTIRPVISGYTKLMGFINSPREASFHLYTRLRPDEVPQHDLHAGLFYDAFLYYLLSNSVSIMSIRDEWHSGTVNHQQFVEAMTSHMTVEQAAYSTWSGRRAISNGFCRMKPVSKTEPWQERYEILFMR